MKKDNSVVKTMYWSRAPGKFVNLLTGAEAFSTSMSNKKELVKEWKLIREYEVPDLTPRTLFKIYQEVEVEKTPSMSLSAGPMFTGTIREWYETLYEIIGTAAKKLEDRTMCRATQIVASPDAVTILENTIEFRMNYKIDDGKNDPYAPRRLDVKTFEDVGTLGNRYKLFKSFEIPSNELKVQVFDPDTKELMDEITIKILDMNVL